MHTLLVLLAFISVAFCQSKTVEAYQFTAIDTDPKVDQWNRFIFYIDAQNNRFRSDLFVGGSDPVHGSFAESQVIFGVPDAKQVVTVYSNSRGALDCTKSVAAPPYFSFTLGQLSNTTFFRDRLVNKYPAVYTMNDGSRPQVHAVTLYLDAFSNQLVYGVGGDHVLFSIQQVPNVPDSIFNEWKNVKKCN